MRLAATALADRDSENATGASLSRWTDRASCATQTQEGALASFRLSSDELVAGGVLDAEAEAGLRANCQRLLEGGASQVVVDLSEVIAMNSMSIGVLVALWIDLRNGGRCLTLKTSPSVRRVLDMTGLTGLLSAVPGREDDAR